MIRGMDLFGREAISPYEKNALKAANSTAKTLFRDRFSPKLVNEWDKPVQELTLEDVEKDVLKAILEKYPKGGKEACTKRGTLAIQPEGRKAL